MKVDGKEIPAAVIREVVFHMRSNSFCASELMRIVRLNDKSLTDQAMRIADRLIQRERKAGNISNDRSRALWRWVPGPVPVLYDDDAAHCQLEVAQIKGKPAGLVVEVYGDER